MSQVTARISDTCDDTYEEAAECILFWRQCLLHPADAGSYDILRWISYEIEATNEAIGFASAREA